MIAARVELISPSSNGALGGAAEPPPLNSNKSRCGFRLRGVLRRCPSALRSAGCPRREFVGAVGGMARQRAPVLKERSKEPSRAQGPAIGPAMKLNAFRLVYFLHL